MRENKDQIAERMYPGVTFDVALPQPWVDMMQELIYPKVEVPPHFVWGYPEGNMGGIPLPISTEGAGMMYQLASEGINRSNLRIVT